MTTMGMESIYAITGIATAYMDSIPTAYNDDHGNGVHIGGGDTRNGVSGARARCHQYGAHLAGGAGVTVGGVGGGLLVAHQNMFYVLLAKKGVVNMQRGSTWVTENELNAFVPQGPD